MCRLNRSSCGCGCGYLGLSTSCNPFPNFPLFDPSVLSTVPILPNGFIISKIPPVKNGCGC